MRKKWQTAAVIFITFIIWMQLGQLVFANVALTDLKDLDLGVRPVDVAATADGKLIFILAPKELLVYSINKEQIVGRIPIAKGFDRLTLSEKADTLILTSSGSNTMKLINVAEVADIDISGLPVQGPADAPLMIAVFDDYQ